MYKLLNELPGAHIRLDCISTLASRVGVKRPEKVDPPVTYKMEPSEVRWRDALLWAKTNKVALTGRAIDDIAAINAARQRHYIPPFVITDLRQQFTIVRRAA